MTKAAEKTIKKLSKLELNHPDGYYVAAQAIKYTTRYSVHECGTDKIVVDGITAYQGYQVEQWLKDNGKIGNRT